MSAKCRQKFVADTDTNDEDEEITGGFSSDWDGIIWARRAPFPTIVTDLVWCRLLRTWYGAAVPPRAPLGIIPPSICWLTNLTVGGVPHGGLPKFASPSPERSRNMAAIRTNQIRPTDDVPPFFNGTPRLDEVMSIKKWAIDCRCYSTQVKVGYAFKRMEEEGLLKDIEEYLAKSGRTISNHYARAYLEDQRHLRGQQINYLHEPVLGGNNQTRVSDISGIRRIFSATG